MGCLTHKIGIYIDNKKDETLATKNQAKEGQLTPVTSSTSVPRGFLFLLTGYILSAPAVLHEMEF